MFSGLRSLCMILFSWRYWIPDPAAIKQWLYTKTRFISTKRVRKTTNSDRTYQRRWAVTALHSPSDHSSFQVCLVTATNTKHISITSVGIVHCILGTNKGKTVTYQTYQCSRTVDWMIELWKRSPFSGLPWSNIPWPGVEDRLRLLVSSLLGHLLLSLHWCDSTWDMRDLFLV